MNLENEKVDVSGSSGERYLCREFVRGETMLAIGMEDEKPAFESERVENGMEYRILIWSFGCDYPNNTSRWWFYDLHLYKIAVATTGCGIAYMCV